MKKLFVNFTNHPSRDWNAEQRRAAAWFGDIVDIPFPEVAPELAEWELAKLAEEQVRQILRLQPTAVLCQGEFTLCYLVVGKLQECGIPVLAACSERKTVQRQMPDGTTRKTQIFEFRCFRAYTAGR